MPTALALSRQKLPVLDRDAIPDDAVERGAYVLRDPEAGGEPDVILIGTGSEVSLCLEAADLLAAEGTSRSASSRCRARPAFARAGAGLPRRGAAARASRPGVSVEAGATFGWDRWVGDAGYAVGIDHFGASAPAADIVEGFGLTAADVAGHARDADREAAREVRLRLRPRRLPLKRDRPRRA